jgi:hypothetical protein
MDSPSSNNYGQNVNSRQQQYQQQQQQPQPQQQVLVLQPEKKSTFRTLYTIFHFIVSIFAIYLSFQCNNGVGKSFDLLSFLAALFFPWIYIFYIFVTRKDFCGVMGPRV